MLKEKKIMFRNKNIPVLKFKKKRKNASIKIPNKEFQR